MSQKNFDTETLEELFAEAERKFDEVVHFAFLHCRHRATPEDIKRFHQRLCLLLLKDDYRRLRTYDQRAGLRTWLQTIANREVTRFLKRESRNVTLEEVPPETFRQQPSQEEDLLRTEQTQLLTETIAKLTPRQQRLATLIRQGVCAEEIAHTLSIKIKSVHRKKNLLLKKLEALVNGEN